MTLSDLLKPRTADEHLATMLDSLRESGWPVDDWAAGSIQRTIFEIMANGLADMDKSVVKIAEGGYLDLAAGKWLDELARSHYGLERQQSTWTHGTVELTADSNSGPWSIQPGQLWLGTAGGLRYQSINAITLPQGATRAIRVKAERPGSEYNVPGSAIAAMRTPLPGVTVTNQPSWITSAGVDTETDESLRRRCRLRWADLGIGRRDAYLFWALHADPAVTKARILDQHPRGEGTVDVVLWGDGGIGSEVVQRVEDFIQLRRPISDDVETYSAESLETTVTATVYVRAGGRAEAEAAVARNLIQLQSDVEIGGTLYRAALIDALMATEGVYNVALTAPAANVAPDPDQVVVLTPALTWEEA